MDSDRPLEADRNAPVYTEMDIDINATPETVWQVITDIERWPEWNPDVREASIAGSVTEGTGFRWKAGPGTIKSIFRRVEPIRVLGWTGTTMGIPAIHIYKLEPVPAGTRVTLEESWAGMLSRLLRKSMQKTLDKAVETGLVALKEEAEHRAGAS